MPGRRDVPAEWDRLETPAGVGVVAHYTDFPSALLENTRTLSVYLPPGYGEDPAARYPVFYLHDGQNVFFPEMAAFGASWQAHATADRLITAGRVVPVILVGVANTPARLDEYAVYHDPAANAGGRGALYARFVAEEVKPFVDATFRTLPGREHTAVAGSSMGGLIALAMARLHPDVFSLCGVMSPSLWWGRGRVFKELRGHLAWMRRVRFWLDMGTAEGPATAGVPPGVAQTRRLVSRFDRAGLLPGWDYCYWEVAGGEHNEHHWAARFDKVLLYFFGR